MGSEGGPRRRDICIHIADSFTAKLTQIVKQPYPNLYIYTHKCFKWKKNKKLFQGTERDQCVSRETFNDTQHFLRKNHRSLVQVPRKREEERVRRFLLLGTIHPGCFKFQIFM